MSNNLVGRVDILANGNVDPNGTANPFISLDNITFKAA
jgi:hypothetical protein